MLSLPPSLAEGRVRPVVDCSGDTGRTRQSFKDECDVNKIISRFETTGVIQHLQQVQGRYADVSHVGSFHEAMNLVRTVRSEFDTLPASLRAKFDNDPAQFLDVVQSMTPDQVRDLVLGVEPSSKDSASSSTPESSTTPEHDTGD